MKMNDSLRSPRLCVLNKTNGGCPNVELRKKKGYVLALSVSF
jgi:hypothetical protein